MEKFILRLPRWLVIVVIFILIGGSLSNEIYVASTHSRYFPVAILFHVMCIVFSIWLILYRYNRGIRD